MIRAQNICCGYAGVNVVHDLSLDIGPGTFTGLLGPNGSGKSTLLAALAGVLPVSGGRVELDGRDVHAMAARERALHLACVPQRTELPFALRCSSIVLMGRFAHQPRLGGDSPKDMALAREAMARCGVEHLWDRAADQVSGGELQRVLFARALTQQAGTLLLDEPAASMDLAGTLGLFDHLKELAAGGSAILCAVHDINLAALYCDTLVFLQQGRVAGAGPVKDVFDETTLTRIYGVDVRVSSHPVTGAPQAHFVPGSADAGVWAAPERHS